VNLPTWPVRDLDVWLPDLWKLRHAASLATVNPRIELPSTTSHPRRPWAKRIAHPERLRR
jgi:hypothetical protein